MQLIYFHKKMQCPWTTENNQDMYCDTTRKRNNNRPQRSCGKVMFLHLLSFSSQGGCLPSACWDTPSCPMHTGIDMATAADGTHSSGMHSCFGNYFWKTFSTEMTQRGTAFLLIQIRVQLERHNEALPVLLSNEPDA